MMKKWYHMILQTHKGDAIATGPRGIQGTRKHVIIFAPQYSVFYMDCTLSRLNDVTHW